MKGGQTLLSLSIPFVNLQMHRICTNRSDLYKYGVSVDLLKLQWVWNILSHPIRCDTWQTHRLFDESISYSNCLMRIRTSHSIRELCLSHTKLYTCGLWLRTLGRGRWTRPGSNKRHHRGVDRHVSPRLFLAIEPRLLNVGYWCRRVYLGMRVSECVNASVCEFR